MTYVERMRTLALLAKDEEIQQLLFAAADRIENLNEWKLLWATTHLELERTRSELSAYKAQKGE